MPILSASQAQDIYQQLPEKWQRSVVGMAYARIVQLLEGDGYASLAHVLQELMPDAPPEHARKALLTQYINRAYTSDSGEQPLKLCMSRARKNAADPAQLWFEGELGFDVATARPPNPRYDDTPFEEMDAQQASGTEQLLAAQERKTSEALSQARTAALLNVTERQRLHGLRKEVSDEEWEESDASQHDMQGAHENPVGQRVKALRAMLEWTQGKADNKAHQKEAGQLLAILGDYGAGKTSHCMRYARVLAGEVLHPAWPREAGLAHKALYIDLAMLAGVRDLGRLSLSELLRIAIEKQTSIPCEPEAVQSVLGQARAGQLVMVYDGLDELLKNDRQVLHNLFGQLLKVLDPSLDAQKKRVPSQAKVIISCRTHYFRDVEQQHAFFDTRKRGVAAGQDYLCLSLLPWTAENVHNYLSKRLSADDANKLKNIIDTTYNLTELASRPVLLAMMCEQLGSLLRQAALGKPITAAQLYNITVAEWIARDDGKHRIAAPHKPLLMGALATALWNDGAESWPAQKLDTWVVRTVAQLFPGEYAPEQMQSIQDDLRTATFIVRPDANTFSFAHRSFAEYFIARFFIEVLEMACMRADYEPHAPVQRWVELLVGLLPTRDLNTESMNFLGELTADSHARGQSPAQHLHALWACMQVGSDQVGLAAPQHGVYQEPKAYENALEAHGVWWKAALVLLKACPGLVKPRKEMHHADLALNLRGLSFVEEEWSDLDFTAVPPLDARGTNFLLLRAMRVKCGRVICDHQTNWAQGLMRDCETGQIEWGNSDRAWLRVRSGDIWARWTKEEKARGLKGPWSLPEPGPMPNTENWRVLEAVHTPKESSMRVRHLKSQEIYSSFAKFDDQGNLIDCNNDAADIWLYRVGENGPELMEFAPVVEAVFSAKT